MRDGNRGGGGGGGHLLHKSCHLFFFLSFSVGSSSIIRLTTNVCGGLDYTTFFKLFKKKKTLHHHQLSIFLTKKLVCVMSCLPNQHRGGMQNGSSVGIHTRCMHGFFCTLGRRFACSVGACQQNFCVGAQSGVLSRMRCWLGARTLLQREKVKSWR